MKKLLELQADRIESVLGLHHISVRVTNGTVTPRWVRFQVLPAMGTKLSRLAGLHQEIAAALNAPSCRVSQRGAAVAIEVPRDDPRPVRLLPLYNQLISEPDRPPIPPITAVLGLAEDGAPLLIRLSSPDVAHVLVAGTTGSGKTVLLQTMILSLAMTNSPDDLAFVLVDPKAHAFRAFDSLPHLARPIVVEHGDISAALDDLVAAMEQRNATPSSAFPTIVVVIDELADLLMVGGKPVQHALTRLAQRGRGVGIHVIAATQKPTAEAIGPLVKANFPVRLVGRVTSIEDARTATGWSGTGAERLTGRGDFLVVAGGRITRFQAAHVTLAEIQEQVACITGPPVSIAWPTLDEPTEPNPDENLARDLIASDLWPSRHGSNGSYRRGFLSSACRLLFDRSCAGVYYTRTKTIRDLAESLDGTSGTKSSTTTADKAPKPTSQPASRPTRSSSSRKKSKFHMQFSGRTSQIPSVAPKLKIIRASTPPRFRIPALLGPPRPLDIAPDRALLIGTGLGFVTGFAVKTLIQLIGGLL